MEREQIKLNFLKKVNFDFVDRIKLKQDASLRRYERLITHEGLCVILMDGPPSEKFNEFLLIGDFLRSNNLSTPNILAQDLENGFLLLEDFGDKNFSELLQQENLNDLSEEYIYSRAVDVLIHLHKNVNISIKLPSYNLETYLNESINFVDWYLGSLFDQQISSTKIVEFKYILANLLGYLDNTDLVFIHRDYHAENLMWLDHEVSLKKVGLLDFQDALVGPRAYDLVSLLEDLRRDVNQQTASKMLRRYLNSFPEIAHKDFNASYAILGLQRNLKIIGFCARQAIKFNNNKYLSMLPRVWRYLNNNLTHPLLLPMKLWLKEVVPNQIKD